MKKIFTSLMVLAAAFTASAQNFTVTGVDDVTYSDGDVINIGYTAGTRPNTIVWNPELIVHVDKATSALTGKSAFTVSAVADVAGYVQFCGLNGQCQMIGGTTVSKNGSYGAGEIIPLEIDIAASKSVIPEPIEVKLTITDGTQTTNLTLNFLTSEQAGIEAPELAESAVRISGRTLTYNVSSAENLTLFNISGRAVLSRTVSGTGSISLDGLPAGVYVYRMASATGKLLVH